MKSSLQIIINVSFDGVHENGAREITLLILTEMNMTF